MRHSPPQSRCTRFRIAWRPSFFFLSSKSKTVRRGCRLRGRSTRLPREGNNKRTRSVVRGANRPRRTQSTLLPSSAASRRTHTPDALVIHGIPRATERLFNYPRSRRRSESFTLGRASVLRFGTTSVPSRTHPVIDAATAQPTSPSHQWLSAPSGRIFHSSTRRPRPSVFTRY